MSYCKAIQEMLPSPRKDLHQRYHDHHYGYPILDDHELFGRLIMEINQAGLSWETILKKEEGFRKAYSNFDIDRVADFSDADRLRLQQDPRIIRNKLKINAAIENAKAIQNLRHDYGSFLNWLNDHHPLSLEEWVVLFKRNFKFVGKEIVNEFLMSTGYLPGAHDEDCPIYKQLQST